MLEVTVEKRERPNRLPEVFATLTNQILFRKQIIVIHLSQSWVKIINNKRKEKKEGNLIFPTPFGENKNHFLFIIKKIFASNTQTGLFII